MTLPTVATPLSTFLGTDGTWIVDANGKRVKLAGVNWAGAHQDDLVPTGLDKQNIDTLCGQLAAWGFNSVRFTFCEAGVIGPQASVVPPASLLAANPALQGLTAWELYQACVARMTAAGLMVIPNKHLIAPGWCCSGSDTNGLWWNANWTNTQYRTMWTTVATAFASNPLVIGYDLDNEPRNAMISGTLYAPTWDASFSNTDFCGNYIATANDCIHPNDTDALIFCEGIKGGQDITGVTAHPVVLNKPNKVVYSCHAYPPSSQNPAGTAAYLDSTQGFVTKPGYANRAPLWYGELGFPNSNYTVYSNGNQVPAPNVNVPDNTTGYWGYVIGMQTLLSQQDYDWSIFQMASRQHKGTVPSTNQLFYNYGDRVWDGLFNDEYTDASNSVMLAFLQSLMPSTKGPH